MIEIVADFICALPSPSAATTAAAGFSSLEESAALGTSGFRGRRSRRFCGHHSRCFCGRMSDVLDYKTGATSVVSAVYACTIGSTSCAYMTHYGMQMYLLSLLQIFMPSIQV